MASTQITPTRMELTRTKRKLATARRGHKLLKDKRDELMRQFLDMARENIANKNFVIAKAGMDEATLNTALMAPKQEVSLGVGKRNVMSVNIPAFETKTRTADANDIYSYGFAFTSSDLDGAVKSLGGEISGGHPAGYVEACRDGESVPADGGGDREDQTSCQCAGARDHTGGAGDHQVYHHEAGRE